MRTTAFDLSYELALMMEQTDTCKAHCDAMLITCFDYIIITNGATRLCNIFYTTAECSLYIVTKWEKRI